MILLEGHIEFDRADHAPLDRSGVQLVAVKVEPGELFPEMLERQAGREQGAYCHIAANARKTVEKEDSHRS